MPSINYCPVCKEYHGNMKRLYYRDESNPWGDKKLKVWNKTDYLMCRKCKSIILEPRTDMTYRTKVIYNAKILLKKDLKHVTTFPGPDTAMA